MLPIMRRKEKGWCIKRNNNIIINFINIYYV